MEFADGDEVAELMVEFKAYPRIEDAMVRSVNNMLDFFFFKKNAL